MTLKILLTTGIPALILLITLSYIYVMYNSLINLRMDVTRQTSHIHVHLKKKFDMIPALAQIVKGYTKHEKGTFEKVTQLRSQWGATRNVNEKVKTANQIENLLSKLLLVQERYPKLKADKSFRSIMRSIRHVEKELVRERKLYNKRVSKYNVKLEEFPSNIIGGLFRFKQRPFYSKEI